MDLGAQVVNLAKFHLINRAIFLELGGASDTMYANKSSSRGNSLSSFVVSHSQHADC